MTTIVGVPSPTMVRTRGLIRVFNADIAVTIRGAVAILFTSQDVPGAQDVGADFSLFTKGSRQYPLWYPFSCGPFLKSDSMATINTTQFDPSPTAGFMIDSKGQYRVKGNDTRFNILATNLSSGAPIDVSIVFRILWMLP